MIHYEVSVLSMSMLYCMTNKLSIGLSRTGEFLVAIVALKSVRTHGGKCLCM